MAFRHRPVHWLALTVAAGWLMVCLVALAAVVFSLVMSVVFRLAGLDGEAARWVASSISTWLALVTFFAAPTAVAFCLGQKCQPGWASAGLAGIVEVVLWGLPTHSWLQFSEANIWVTVCTPLWCAAVGAIAENSARRAASALMPPAG
jgi:hypothetical protein